MASLETLPARGNYPPEMQRWGISDFREIFFKPYRIIYEINDKSVFIHAVLDGRRNCEDLLEQRLLRA
jgi:toxin ParE1/3/4